MHPEVWPYAGIERGWALAQAEEAEHQQAQREAYDAWEAEAQREAYDAWEAEQRLEAAIADITAGTDARAVLAAVTDAHYWATRHLQPERGEAHAKIGRALLEVEL